MTLLKSELKASAVHEIGVKIEDMLEASKQEFSEAKGIRAGFDFGTRRLEQLSVVIDNDFKADPPKLTEEEYRTTKKVIGQCIALLHEEVKKASEQAFRMQGKVAALDQVVKSTSTMLKIEEGKIEAFKSGNLVVEGEGLPGAAPGDAAVLPIRRKEGEHPGNPIAAFRARETEGVAAPPAPPPAEEPKPRRRWGGRRKKGEKVTPDGKDT